ncbi:MAG: hypothetical protein WAK17_24785 [Candidatus Nitrosopolaris sp.]|jgi:hypothetical protein
MLQSLMIRLETTEDDKARLLETMKRYNELCMHMHAVVADTPNKDIDAIIESVLSQPRDVSINVICRKEYYTALEAAVKKKGMTKVHMHLDNRLNIDL